jgi:hypothetical protein
MSTRRQHRRGFPLVPLLLSLLAAAAYGRLISDGAPSAPLLSVIRLSGSPPAAAAGKAAEEKCEQSYGFLPCTTTVLGNLFLVLTYGFLMYKAATYLSTGSELLLEIMGPGLVGGLLLPILGALPDALLVLGSLSSSPSFASLPSVARRLILCFALMNRQAFGCLLLASSWLESSISFHRALLCSRFNLESIVELLLLLAGQKES